VKYVVSGFCISCEALFLGQLRPVVFLMHDELALVDQRIAPLNQVNLVHLSVAVVVDDYFGVEGILDCLHPVYMNDAGSYHLPLTRHRNGKSELYNF
jgi:hypothetical protein